MTKRQDRNIRLFLAFGVIVALIYAYWPVDKSSMSMFQSDNFVLQTTGGPVNCIRVPTPQEWVAGYQCDTKNR